LEHDKDFSIIVIDNCQHLTFILPDKNQQLSTTTLAKQALYYLSHTPSPFCSGYFGDGVLQTTGLGWP
jgi:hypothetical protein